MTAIVSRMSDKIKQGKVENEIKDGNEKNFKK